jgi:hypothetical protein
VGLGCGCSKRQREPWEEHLPAQCANVAASSSRPDQTSEVEFRSGQVRSGQLWSGLSHGHCVAGGMLTGSKSSYPLIDQPPRVRVPQCRRACVPVLRASTSRGAVLRNTLPCDCTRPVPASVATPSGIADGIGRGTRSTRTLALSGYSVSLVSRGGPTGTRRRACARRKDARDAFRRLPTRRRAPRQHALQRVRAVGKPQDDG